MILPSYLVDISQTWVHHFDDKTFITLVSTQKHFSHLPNYVYISL